MEKAGNLKKDIYKMGHKLELETTKIRKLIPPNNELLLDFKERYCIKNKLTETRTFKLLNTLSLIARFFNKPLNKLKETDFERLNVELAKRNYTRNTINDYRIVSKIWLRFLGEKENWDLLHCKELKAIPAKNGDSQLDPDELPSDEEVLSLLNILSPKYKAFLAVLDGAGARCSEAATLLRKNVHFNEDGSATINSVGKTGRNSVKIHAGLTSYIADWANRSPLKDDEAPFFPSPSGGFLSYTAIRIELMEAAKKIGIYGKKKVNPHIFRHRAASWALLNMPPVLAKKRIWNNASTKMDRVYGHFTKIQENEAYDIATGARQKTELKQEPFKIRVCFKCGKSHKPTDMICVQCQIYLDPKKIVESLEKQDDSNLSLRVLELEKELNKVSETVLHWFALQADSLPENQKQVKKMQELLTAMAAKK